MSKEHLSIIKRLPLLADVDSAGLQLIAEAAGEREFAKNEIIMSQHDWAGSAYFLLEGTVQFLISVQDEDDLVVGTNSEPYALIGWSVFSPPHRYTVTTRCETPCRVLEIKHTVFDKLFESSPPTAFHILRSVAATVANRIEQAQEQLVAANMHRSRTGADESGAIDSDRDTPEATDIRAESDDPETLLARSAFFKPLSTAQRYCLAAYCRPRPVSRGETVAIEDAPVDALYVVIAGRFELSITPKTTSATGTDAAASSSAPIRILTLNEPGDTIGWSAFVPPYRYLANATALTSGRLLVLDREQLDALTKEDPKLAVALVRRALWIADNRLRAVRTRLIASRYDQEILVVKVLLNQSIAMLPMTSQLFKVPLHLENRLTVADALDCLALVRAHGNETERYLAGLCLDILGNVRRELDFYRGLLTVYELVANAPAEAGPNLVRLRSTRELMSMFEGLDYVIEGEENLPDSPGHIFVMNHVWSHNDTRLPNNFKLTMDTHFVSSMILYRKYGEAPIRVVRGAHPHEIGQQAYYCSRLGYIVIPVTQSAPGEARRKFMEGAKAHLLDGKNIVICPEGDPRSTEESPQPFKTGAFHLAAGVQPEPLIVPIALANFDKKVTRTRLVAIIHEPFRLSEAVSGSLDRDGIREFTDALHERYRGWVEQARRLASGAHEVA